jgi:hypothetical protein
MKVGISAVACSPIGCGNTRPIRKRFFSFAGSRFFVSLAPVAAASLRDDSTLQFHDRFSRICQVN